MVRDLTADFLNNLYNAGMAGKESITVSGVKIVEAAADLLSAKGFIGEVTKKGKKAPKELEIAIKYEGKSPVISGFKRISKSSKRIYMGNKDMKPFKSGYGIMVVSTSKGLMSTDDARKAKLGGEIMFAIW